MRQLRVRIDSGEEGGITVVIGNEGGGDLLVDGVELLVDHRMEIVATPHIHGAAFLSQRQRQLQRSEQAIIDNAAVINDPPAYATAYNDPPPIFELIILPDPYS